VQIADNADNTDLTRQAAVYEAVLDVCLRLAPRCTGFTTWGSTDRYSWIPKFYPGFGRALPFDGGFQPKALYDSLIARFTAPLRAGRRRELPIRDAAPPRCVAPPARPIARAAARA